MLKPTGVNPEIAGQLWTVNFPKVCHLESDNCILVTNTLAARLHTLHIKLNISADPGRSFLSIREMWFSNLKCLKLVCLPEGHTSIIATSLPVLEELFVQSEWYREGTFSIDSVLQNLHTADLIECFDLSIYA